MLKRIAFLFVFSGILLHPTFAQKQGQAKVDSLLSVLKKAKEDTNKVVILNNLSDEYETMGEYVKENNFGKEGLALAQKLQFKKGEAKCYINIGNLYWYQSNYNKALENYLSSLKINEEIGNKKGIAYGYLCVGDIYLTQGNFNKALENNLLAINTNKEIGDKKGIAESYNDRATIYLSQGNYDRALECELIAQNIAKEMGIKLIVANSYNIIGDIYSAKGDYSKAIINYQSALQSAKELGNKNIIAATYFFIGNLLVKQNKNKESREYFEKALTHSREIGSKELLKNIYGIYSELDAVQNNYKSAYNNYKLYVIYRDSISNSESARKTMQTQMQFDFDKKQVADSIKSGEEKKVISAKLQQEKTISYTLYGGVVLLLVFGGFMFNRFKVTQKQKNIIELKEKETVKQKNIIEEKQREILDSIEYALRIQTAILPPHKIIKQYLENSFILYKPKDIVAGDFYWMETVEPTTNNQQQTTILFAACDCTGHGVPGAMVSVVCHNALNRAVREFGLTQPAAILDKTAAIVIENFSKSEEDIKDGMDISLCSLNIKTMELQWAGANNPFWIMRSTQLLEETKADKQPIGMNEDSTPFTNHTFTLNSGDTLYLFTDGFADQFGGDTGEKKLTRKRFKEVLQHIQNKSMDEQGVALDKFINEYRKEVEQIDDILVMGVRV